MKLVYDPDQFEDLQEFLTSQIVKSIRGDLVAARVPKAKLEELTTSIAFNVCAAIDGSLIMKRKGKEVLPILTFAEDADKKKLIHARGSDMHEFVQGVARKVFK